MDTAGGEARNETVLADPPASYKNEKGTTSSGIGKRYNHDSTERRSFNNRFNYTDSAAIFLDKCSGRIIGNIIEDQRKIHSGISLGISNNIEVRNNDIRNCYTAIFIIGGSPTIFENTLSNNRLGIDIWMAVGDVFAAPNISENSIENNDEYGIRIREYITETDLGGVKKGSLGRNRIRNNRKWDLLNESPSSIYAINNYWTFSTAEEIDKFCISDDEDGSGGQVVFIPFLLPTRSSSPLSVLHRAK